MIKLHYGNQLENLIEPLAASIASRQRTRPLERISIIVPSRPVEQFIRFRVAARIGVAANLEFPFLRACLGRFVHSANPDVSILEAEQLQTVIFECLRNPATLKARELKPVRQYVSAGSERRQDRELRTFQLSGQMARLFREYSISRRAMTRGWRDGPKGFRPPFDGLERWQRHVWRLIFEDDGGLRRELTTEPKPRWMMLPDGFDAVGDRELKRVLPETLHVFGLAYVGPEFVRIFDRLGKLTHVQLYALNPCREFWEDVEGAKASERRAWIHRGERLAGDWMETEDPFKLGHGDNPALRLWGIPGREHIRLLNQLTACDFDSHFSTVNDSDNPTILHRVQQSILDREPELPPVDQPGAAADDSIRILACPGIRREVEIVASEIWRLIDDEEGARSRSDRHSMTRFHEIAVLAPDDAFDSYQPHIETVFAGQHGIPVNLLRRPFSSRSRVAEAIELLLDLPLGRFARNEMLNLLTHPAITGGDPEIEVERWAGWCRELGVFLGADQEDLKDTYIPHDLYHWDQALRRLELGVFMAGEASGEARYFEAPPDHGYLPFEVAEEHVPSVARLVHAARSLLEDAVFLRKSRLRLAQWAKLLSEMVAHYVHTTEPIDERVRDRCLEAIGSIAARGFRTEPVGYEVVRQLILEAIANIESKQQRYTQGGVAVGSMSALRGLPFKTIFVLGLGESAFPARDRRDPLDLRLVRRQAGDVTTTERDRYLFLEALCAARERLRLSYVSRDPPTGDPLEPSSVIHELEFILRGYLDNGALNGLTVVHPVSRYDPKYFPGLTSRTGAGDQTRSKAQMQRGSEPDAARSDLSNYDSRARSVARMAALRASLRNHVGRNLLLPGRADPLLNYLPDPIRASLEDAIGVLKAPAVSHGSATQTDAISLSLTALRKYLECPLQGAARYALRLADDEADESAEAEDEPLAESNLDRAILLRDVFRRKPYDPKEREPEYDAVFLRAQMKGQAPAGAFQTASRRSDLTVLEAWQNGLEAAGVANYAGWGVIRIGSAVAASNLLLSLPPIVLDVTIPGPEDHRVTRRVTLHGTLDPISPQLDRSVRFVARREVTVKDFLGMFLSAIALAAAGQNLAEGFAAIVIGGGKDGSRTEPRVFNPPSQEQAIEYLRSLVSDLLYAKNDYFLPIEAVAAVYEELRNSIQAPNLIKAIEGARGNEHRHSSSDYGPLRDTGRFPPPGPAAVRSILRRRFDLLKSIFEKP